MINSHHFLSTASVFIELDKSLSIIVFNQVALFSTCFKFFEQLILKLNCLALNDQHFCHSIKAKSPTASVIWLKIQHYKNPADLTTEETGSISPGNQKMILWRSSTPSFLLWTDTLPAPPPPYSSDELFWSISSSVSAAATLHHLAAIRKSRRNKCCSVFMWPDVPTNNRKTAGTWNWVKSSQKSWNWTKFY